MSDQVQMVCRDGICTITLNRPAVLNALDPALIESLHQALRQAALDAAVRCVILTGAGEHFMAGGDLAYFRDALPEIERSHGEHLRPFFQHVHGVIREIRRMQKPVIASVRGAAAGYGLSLVLACDLAIAADDAKFTTAYCHVGLTPDGGMSYFLPRLVGSKRAAELLFLGERFDAPRALQWGVINKQVPKESLAAETFALAQNLATKSAQALARSKQLLQNAWDKDFETQLDREQHEFIASAQTSDFREGVQAFCEKRTPVFR